jgi:hypothetical protein
MSPQRLNILCVSQMPASPPRFGAQVRTHALMPQLARHHELTAVMLVHEEFDIEECRRAMQVYCREVDWSTTVIVIARSSSQGYIDAVREGMADDTDHRCEGGTASSRC